MLSKQRFPAKLSLFRTCFQKQSLSSAHLTLTRLFGSKHHKNKERIPVGQQKKETTNQSGEHITGPMMKAEKQRSENFRWFSDNKLIILSATAVSLGLTYMIVTEKIKIEGEIEDRNKRDITKEILHDPELFPTPERVPWAAREPPQKTEVVKASLFDFSFFKESSNKDDTKNESLIEKWIKAVQEKATKRSHSLTPLQIEKLSFKDVIVS